MADDRDEALRESARHRGLRLVKSRRRKPGGDFGLYGLKEPGGKPVFGIESDALKASAEEVEDYLRGAVRDTWSKSAEGKRTKPAKAAPRPKEKPKPKFKVEVANLFAKLPAAKRREAFTELLSRPGVKIERIVSQGQATPEDDPMVQDSDEWVVLLQGAAGIRIEDSAEVKLAPGDHVFIARGQKHWVTFTDPDAPSVWLAVHLG